MRGGSKFVEVDKSTTKDHALKHTSMKAWRVSGWNSLAGQNGFPVFDIDMVDMSIQLYKTSSSGTLIPFCKESLEKREKQNEFIEEVRR